MQVPSTLPTLLRAATKDAKTPVTPATTVPEDSVEDRLVTRIPFLGNKQERLVVKKTFFELEEISLFEKASSLRRCRSEPALELSEGGRDDATSECSFGNDSSDFEKSSRASLEDAKTSGSSLPLGAGKGVLSVGSALHSSGTCKPCAWFWKPEGCQNGKDCLHCHRCPQGEVTRLKKLHKAMKWQQKHAQRYADKQKVFVVPMFLC